MCVNVCLFYSWRNVANQKSLILNVFEYILIVKHNR